MEFKDNVQILCTPGKRVDKSSVKVEWSQNYGRKTLPLISEKIEKEWNKKCLLFPSMWNGSKFRLHEIQLEKENDCDNPQIKLLLGPTDYKDYMGTNCSSDTETLVNLGLQDHGNSQAYASDPLGNGALLLTNDNNIIFIRRSGECAEFQFMVDRPGGHPEPDDVIAIAGEDFQKMDPSYILEEVFDSILKEVTEEVNIPAQNLSSPIILGVSYNPATMRAPSIEFYIRCDLNTNEVKKLYTKRCQVNLDESTELIIIPVEEVLGKTLEEMKYYDQLTFGAKAVLSFFKVFSSK